jgi:predicted phage terminase large subunit-like protein
MSRAQVSQTELEHACALAADSLAAYAQLLMPTYKLGRHLAEIIRSLEQLERGDKSKGDPDRLLILAPPRHGKSQTVSQFFPAWFLGRNPELKVIIGACAGSLAEDFGAAVRNYMQDPLHRMTFPRCRLSADSQARDKFTTTRGGQFFAVGRGTVTVGRGAHLFVVDDPLVSQEEAQSEEMRRKVKQWFTSVAYTRLMPGGRVIICQTLWHEDDLAGWLQRESDDNWKIIRYPAIAEEDEPWRKKGEALWPEFYALPELERIRDKSGMTTAEWMSLYQQRCVGDDGAIFKLAWLRNAYLDRELVPQQVAAMPKYILVDPANSKRRGSDYTAMWVLGLGADKNVYVLDGVRDKLGLRERADELFRLHRTWKPVTNVLYEEYGLQSDIQYIRERQQGLNGQMPYHFNIVPVGGKVRKEERIRRLEPWFRDGRFKFPRFMPRVAADGKQYNLTALFEDEYKSFPVGAHDDLFDCLARIADPDNSLQWPLTDEEMQEQDFHVRRSRSRGTWMSA